MWPLPEGRLVHRASQGSFFIGVLRTLPVGWWPIRKYAKSLPWPGLFPYRRLSSR